MCYILCRIIHVLLVYSTKLGRSLASRERCLNEFFFSRHLCINDFKGPRQKIPLSWTTLHLGSTMEIILTHVSSLIPCFHVLLAGNSDTSAVSKTSIKTEWKWFLLAWNPCAILATKTGLSMVNVSRWACKSLRKGVLRLQSLWKACMCVCGLIQLFRETIWANTKAVYRQYWTRLAWLFATSQLA